MCFIRSPLIASYCTIFLFGGFIAAFKFTGKLYRKKKIKINYRVNIQFFYKIGFTLVQPQQISQNLLTFD